MTENEKYINKMYDSNLKNTQAQLEADHAQDQANLDEAGEAARKQTQENLQRTYVEAAKRQKNYQEVQNAYGMTSGAMAQARLAQDNQLQADMTAIRTAQQEADAGIQRQRSTLAQQYAAAITKAQQENDLARAQALYEEARRAEDALNQQHKEKAALLAEAGDYSLYKGLYGLTDAQVETLNASAAGSTGGMDTMVKLNLQSKYPGGKVTDAESWKLLVTLYGEKALTENGFVFSTAADAEAPKQRSYGGAGGVILETAYGMK